MPTISQKKLDSLIAKNRTEAYEQGVKIGYDAPKPQAYEPLPPPFVLFENAEIAVEYNGKILEFEEKAQTARLIANILKQFPEAVKLF